ncbi:zinc-binding dehydrogenase [Streptomyces sp. NPDC001414]
MRGVVFRRNGDAAEVAELSEIAEPRAPRPGEISVRVTLTPVHRGDLVGAERAVLPAGATFSRMGSEAVGTVIAVGGDVTDRRVGERVAVFPAPGAWSERITVPAAAAVAVPEAVSDAQAAVLLVNVITSREILRAVEQVRAEAGAGADTPLVVSAAASAVGKLIVQQAVDRGWPVTAVVRSDRSARIVDDLFPAVPVVVTDHTAWRDELRTLVGEKSLPVVTDAHGGSFVEDMLPFLADAGTVVVWGDLAASPWTLSTSELLDRELGVRAVSILRWMTRPDEVRELDLQAAVELAAEHPDLLAVSAVYPLEELKAAVDSARTHGAGTTLLSPGAE